MFSVQQKLWIEPVIVISLKQTMIILLIVEQLFIISSEKVIQLKYIFHNISVNFGEVFKFGLPNLSQC